MTFDRCILNPLHRAAAVHHLRYRDWFGAIAGRERPGWDVVPLCRKCHGIVHRQQLWYSALKDPKRNNRQRWPVLWRLRLRFWGWWFVLRWGWLVLLVAIAEDRPPKTDRRSPLGPNGLHGADGRTEGRTDIGDRHVVVFIDRQGRVVRVGQRRREALSDGLDA